MRANFTWLTRKILDSSEFEVKTAGNSIWVNRANRSGDTQIFSCNDFAISTWKKKWFSFHLHFQETNKAATTNETIFQLHFYSTSSFQTCSVYLNPNRINKLKMLFYERAFYFCHRIPYFLRKIKIESLTRAPSFPRRLIPM
jgi:hypothetical protein